MSKEAKYILAIAIILLLLYLFRQKLLKVTGISLPGDRVLRKGDTGDDVARLQMKLNDLINQAFTQHYDEVNLVGSTSDGTTFYIKTLIPVTGTFSDWTEVALFALTGSREIYVSAIDTLKLPSIQT